MTKAERAVSTTEWHCASREVETVGCLSRRSGRRSCEAHPGQQGTEQSAHRENRSFFFTLGYTPHSHGLPRGGAEAGRHGHSHSAEGNLGQEPQPRRIRADCAQRNVVRAESRTDGGHLREPGHQAAGALPERVPVRRDCGSIRGLRGRRRTA